MPSDVCPNRSSREPDAAPHMTCEKANTGAFSLSITGSIKRALERDEARQCSGERRPRLGVRQAGGRTLLSELAKMVHSELSVILYSADTGFSNLVTLNLERRGFLVRQQAWSACHARPRDPTNVPEDIEVVIADLDCTGPACWFAVAHLRRLARSLPVVVLAYEWPNAGRLGRCFPCGYLRKPFAMEELFRVLKELLPAAA
jgi:hypothetical protein